MKTPSALSLLVGLFFLAGGSCQNTRETLTGEWQETLEGMTLRPVYPPRQDFQVGDIYLSHPDAAALEQWVSTLDLGDVAAKFQKGRGPFSGKAVRPASTAPRNAMHLVVFPEFSGINVRGRDIDWLVPSEALSLAEGESWQGDHEVTLKISSASSYGLPFNLISKAMIEETSEGETSVQRLRPELGISLSTLARTQALPATSPDPHVRLEVVTEVYYAHAFDISVTRLRQPARDVTEPIELVDASIQDNNKGLVEALNQRLVGVDSSTPGTNLRILGATDATIVLRRTFEEPIAVGYRSMRVTLNKKTGEVVSYDSHNPIPKADKPATRRDRFDLEGALALELDDHLQGKAELLEVRYDPAISRWRLQVRLYEGAEAPFIPRSQRSAIAERAGERTNRLSGEDKRRLQRFVDAGGIIFETR
jgi:hypothetical protein